MADRDGDCLAEDSATELFETVGFLVAQFLPSKGLLPRIGASRQTTALRPEECFALKWSDIDSANSQIFIQRAWSKGKETSGKTKGSMKPVAMHPALASKVSIKKRQSWR
jgi:integrase